MTTQIDQPLTEKRIANLLMRDRWMKGVCMPSYAPAGWWENDVFLITESGYWWEFEIKLTVADFKRDDKKQQTVYPEDWSQPKTYRRKHEMLAGSEHGPAQFYYVAPVDVIPLSMLPPWAGLIEIQQDMNTIYEKRPTVKAPRRHTNKADPHLRTAAIETCHYRFHRLR